MKLVRRGDLTPGLWKNGGGRTWEIAAFPEGADLNGFLWRLSMAEVAADGPFSIFSGVDRTLTVLVGTGLAFDFAGGGSISLDAACPPLAFPGEAAIAARVTAGPVLDFNVMTRRGKVYHHVAVLAAGTPAPRGTVALVARAEPARFAGHQLAPTDALIAAAREDLAGFAGDVPLLAVVLAP